jgi:cytochrome d ubiquinol oxidase subunit II
MTHDHLQMIWFLLIGVLLVGYTILDGYDLGAGFWHLFAKKEEHKTQILNSVGPFWDGNEVWLLTGGGALFAAFPHVYATVFSGFYLALMLVLLALICRAVSIEYRNKVDSPGWKRTWDLLFGLGSALPALLFGVALGNVLRGIPLNESHTFTGNFFTLLNPYALLFGLTGLAMFMTHGAVYIAMKSDKDLGELAGKWAKASWLIYLVLFVVLNISTIVFKRHLGLDNPIIGLNTVIAIFVLVDIMLLGFAMRRGEFGRAFLMSSIGMAGLWLMVGVGLFPNIVYALDAPEYNLTITNASSSRLTLQTMFIIALIGMPFVIGYTIWAQRALGGKVGIEPEEY